VDLFRQPTNFAKVEFPHIAVMRASCGAGIWDLGFYAAFELERGEESLKQSSLVACRCLPRRNLRA